MIKIKMLKANSGDCFIISFNDGGSLFHNILVDGGTRGTYSRFLKKEIKVIVDKGEVIDLVVVTHIDNDHIGGILKFFEDDSINKSIVKKVFFNSARALAHAFNIEYDENRELELEAISTDCSQSQGISFEKLLLKQHLLDISIVKAGDVFHLGEAKLTILSPLVENLRELSKNWIREKDTDTNCSASESDYHIPLEQLQLNETFVSDDSLPNKSSIAFLLEYKDSKLLMLGDSFPSVIIDSLKKMGYSEQNKLIVNCIKLAHHGSKKSTSYDLLHIIQCSNYLLSANFGKNSLPNKETLARIIKTQKKVIFNYNYEYFQEMFKIDDLETHEFRNELVTKEIEIGDDE